MIYFMYASKSTILSTNRLELGDEIVTTRIAYVHIAVKQITR